MLTDNPGGLVHLAAWLSGGSSRSFQQAIPVVCDLERQIRASMARWLSRLDRWNLCAIMTYDPRLSAICAPSSSSGYQFPGRLMVEEHVRLWLVRWESVLGRPCRAVFVGDNQVPGHPRWHGLLAIDEIDEDDVICAKEIWAARFGYAYLARARSPRSNGPFRRQWLSEWPLGVTTYCTTYFCEPDGTLLLHGFSASDLEAQLRQVLAETVGDLTRLPSDAKRGHGER